MGYVRNRLPVAFAACVAIALSAWIAPAEPAQADLKTLKQLQQERVALARKLSPSVVALAPERPDLSEPEATGLAGGSALAASGFVVDDDYVITNNESGATNDLAVGGKVWLMSHDGTEFSGKVVGRDQRNLLLVVKMDEGHPKLPSLKLANSDAVPTGATAVSLGNSLDSMLVDRVVTFSYGTVCGFYRFEPIGVLDDDEGGDPYKGNVLEIDCALHAGDHGGPVCNLDGEVIGMSIPHWMAGRHMGTCVPSNQIRAVLPQLKKGVKEEDLAQAKLGFKAKWDPAKRGIYISGVTKNGPAEKAGFKVGMQLTRVDNYLVPKFERLKEMLGIGYIVRKQTIESPFGGAREVEIPVSYGVPIGTHIQITLKDPETGREKTVDLITQEKEDDF